MTLVKVGGIGLGIMAVLLLYHHGGDVSRRTTMRLGLGIIIAASLTRSLYGVISKAGLEAGADSDGLIMISAVCWVVPGFLYAVFVERRPAVTRDNVGYALVSGCLVYGIVKSLITALQFGEASVVIPIANMSFIMALLIALALRMERLSMRKTTAIAIAVAAIVLLSRV